MTGELDETRPPRAVAGSPAVPGGTANVRDGRRWLILAVIGLAQLMVVLDATIVNIALPSAQRALGFSTTDRQWVVTGYALAFGGLLLVGGRLSDLFGRKRTFIAGLAGFAVASAVGTRPADTGVAAAMVNTSNQVGGSLGAALLNTIAATAAASYLVSHPDNQDALEAVVHGDVTAFTFLAALFVAGAIITGLLHPSRAAVQARQLVPGGGA